MQIRVVRDTVVWSLIILVHVLLIWIVTRSRGTAWQAPENEITADLVWLPQPAADPVNVPLSAGTKRKPTTAMRPRPNRAITAVFVTTPSPTAIDWLAESKAAGARLAAQLQREPKHPFTIRPDPRFKVCKKKKSHFEWDAEVNETPLARAWPKFKAGKHCLIVPPFFSCTLEDPPPPNGKLLDDMRKPDRPRSSVPSDDDCEPPPSPAILIPTDRSP